MLDSTEVPLSFICGEKDPVSGKHVLDSIRHLGKTFAWPVGHYPHWEDPDRVVQAILEVT